MWPSPRSMDAWIKKTLTPTMKGEIALFVVGNGFFIFLFENKEDKEVIFRNGPYLFGSRGMYLNIWTLDFNPDEDIPTPIRVWFKLLHLPILYWSDDCLRVIGNGVGKYLDKYEPKGS